MSELPPHIQNRTREDYLQGLYIMPSTSPESLSRMTNQQLKDCMRAANIIFAEILVYEHVPGMPYLEEYGSRADAYLNAYANRRQERKAS